MQILCLLQDVQEQNQELPFLMYYYSFPSGYDALSYSVGNGDKWSGRQLLQAREKNVTDFPEDGGQLYIRNCTEPGRNESCL